MGLRALFGGRRPLSNRKLKNPLLCSSEEFEILCAEIYKRRGYKVELTQKGGDYGIDAVAKKRGSVVAIGAKCYAPDRPVGNRWVQQLLGAMYKCGADSAVLITTSGFTKSAVEQAKNAPITLIGGPELDEIIRGIWF